MRYLIIGLLLSIFLPGCSGVRFHLGDSHASYNLSTCELIVLDAMDAALDEMETQIASEGLPAGSTASLQILGIHSPEHLHPYIRRLVQARLENHGLEIIKEKKLVMAGQEVHQDDDFEYWSADLANQSSTDQVAGENMKQQLLAGADSLLKPQPGQLPDLRIVLALRTAGIDIKVEDYVLYKAESLKCRVHAKLFFFGENTVKEYAGKHDSQDYIYRRRVLWFIPIPAPYKELETDQRSMLRKILDSVFGIFRSSKEVTEATQGPKTYS